MIEKNKILESWIMVEHLSEGDFKNDKSMLTLDEMHENDFYTFFRESLDAQKKASSEKKGLAFYIEIFEFKEVVNFLRESFKLSESYDDLRFGKKFSLVLYFNNSLEFLSDKTFFTVSSYIRTQKKVPDERTLHEFEDELKLELSQKFDQTAENAEAFNRAVKFTVGKYGGGLKSCRVKILSNVENEEVNLHSFFIDDLERAKSINSEILKSYLYGNTKNRVNLDSKRDSKNFNQSVFESILQPQNYPSGRFPGNTRFALSFMQQTAVNICLSNDNKPVKSVNGPPGTGKTTLLKDIFAELVVRQARDISKLSERKMKGTNDTKYSEYGSVGVIPDYITENSIVVASSNNGAVQNIVNELPLISAIDEELIEELRSADYFLKLSNSKLKIEFVPDENGKKHPELIVEPNEGEEKFWGLFSLEGGRSQNMDNITRSVQHIAKYLTEEYEPDFGVYKAFSQQYDSLQRLKSDVRRKAGLYTEYTNNSKAYADKKKDFDSEKVKREKTLSQKLSELKVRVGQFNSEKNQRAEDLKRCEARIAEIKEETAQLNSLSETLKSGKPSLFAGRQEKERYKQQFNGVTERLIRLSEEEAQCRNSQKSLTNQISVADKNSGDCRSKMQSLKDEFDRWVAEKEKEISDLKNTVTKQKQTLSENEITPLDMQLDYEELQLSNPWFNREFRKQQSRLFITALRVRKQFLYENVKSLKGAAFAWNKYPSNKPLMAASWSWINMAIPVISSTFASFSNMCRNFEPQTLGHLFVDEAGQALPQAAVGAVFRSRYVTVVGDPSQIQPVLTLNADILEMLGKHYGVNQKYLSDSASVQTLCDAASSYGYYRDKEKSDESWIGIPLWVHRRCRYPMFSISNKISYDGLMVQADKRLGKTGWFNVKGQANDKYVEAQGEFLCAKLSQMIKENPKINDKSEKDIVYVITPFSNVAYRLSQKLKQIGFTRFSKDGKPTNIGTIHTFQGKEAPIVFMVLGADSQSKRSASWAVSTPNMMNVAATRAKEEFYIIGDRQLYLELDSDVINDTYEIINDYSREHPDNSDSNVEAVMAAYSAEHTSQSKPEEPKKVSTKKAVTAPQTVATPAAPSETPTQDSRLEGTVNRVCKGKVSTYAYISGSDGKSYTVSETAFDSFSPEAQSGLKEGARVTFTAKGKYVKSLAVTGCSPHGLVTL